MAIRDARHLFKISTFNKRLKEEKVRFHLRSFDAMLIQLSIVLGVQHVIEPTHTRDPYTEPSYLPRSANSTQTSDVVSHVLLLSSRPVDQVGVGINTPST
jgi:hypothetical protein